MVSTVLQLYAQDTDIEKYLKIVEKDPGNYEAYNMIGLLMVEKNDHEEARNYFVKSVILKNNYFDGYFNLGLLYYTQKEYNKALINLKRALSIKNDQIDTYIMLINCSLKQNNSAEAEKFYKEAFEQFGQEDHRLLNCGGIIKMLSANYKEAKNLFIDALKLKDDDKIKNNLAICEYYSGNKKKAKSMLKSLGSTLQIMKKNYKLVQ